MIAQQITQYIYEAYQPEQFYSKYLKECKCRVDGRSQTSHRNIKISISNNSVTVARGSTIIIAHLKTQIQAITYSPVTQSYGKPLLSLNVQSVAQGNKFERSAGKAIQKFVEDFINWKDIESQIVGQKADQKQQLYGHVGEISIKIADSDGCLDDTVLLATQFLLWTCQFTKIGGKVGQKHNLKLKQFWFPIKYCEILDEIIVDPLRSQQKACKFELTILKNLKSEEKVVKIQKIHGVSQSNILPLQVIQGIQKLYNTQISKLPFDIDKIQIESLKTEKQIIVISGL